MRLGGIGMEEQIRILMERKKKFLINSLIFLFVFYFGLPFSLTFFPEWMNRSTYFNGLTWGWIFAFAQIPMTWILGSVYAHKANDLDRLQEEMKQGGRM